MMLEQIERQDKRPIKLHTREVEGHLGGHKWSRPFAAHLHSIVKEHRCQWWHDAYVSGRVQAVLTPEAYAAVLAWKRDGGDYQVIAAAHKHPHGWLGMQEARAGHIAKSLLEGDHR